MYIQKPTQQQIDAVIESYHKFPTKGITIEMLKEARNMSALGLCDIKNILTDYIKKLSKTYTN